MAKLGYCCILIDMRFDMSHDILKQKLQLAIMGWIRAKHVVFVWMGILCKSWSRARNMPGGTAMLRNTDNIYARLEKDQEKVNQGNAMMYFAARVMRACVAGNIGAAIENPWSSWIWKTHVFKVLVSHSGGRHLARPDFCIWGTPWQKGTGIMTNANPSVAERRCTGCPRGLCRRTGKPHIELRGTLPDGRFLTAVAEPYPRSLCTALARMAHNHIISGQAAQWTRICNS